MKKLNTYCSIGCLSVVLSILSSCSPSRQEFDISYKLIPVDARWDKTPEPLMEQIVDKYKTSVDSIMSIVIGKSSQYMAPGRPETPLTNLSADIIKTETQRDFGQPVDFAIINTGGIRNPLMQGDITLGEIYSIFPFDNTLCLIKLKRFRCTRVTQYRSFPERRGREQRCTHDYCRRKSHRTDHQRQTYRRRSYLFHRHDRLCSQRRGSHDPVPECNRTEKQQHFHERCRYKFHRERKPGGTHHRTSQRGTHNLIE